MYRSTFSRNIEREFSTPIFENKSTSKFYRYHRSSQTKKKHCEILDKDRDLIRSRERSKRRNSIYIYISVEEKRCFSKNTARALDPRE